MSFKIPQTGIQRKLLDINLDDIQNHQNSHDFSLQLNSNMHQSKDEFENHVNQSYSEYNSAFWTSLRNIWKHPDREDTNLITDKDDEHMDELKLREQKTYKEDYENHRTRKMRELQPKTGPNYYENMDCYVHSPGMTSDSSDCVSLSSILDM
ncbi:unnamed protein product [Schistosoma turkestanicum]|nr:unnamed protein product [Schistosoma turkestanicum]